MKPRAEFTVYQGQASVTHPLPLGSTVVVGRGHKAQIRIDDPSVSREHLVLHIGEKIEVEDLGSANGTFLARGVRSDALRNVAVRLPPGERAILEPGTLVRIGSVPCALHVEELTTRVQHTTIPPSSGGRAVVIDPKMTELYELAARAARSEIGVLIHGETGSGKELLAEAVHAHSKRSGRQLLRVNCGAIAENLLESELFGHERGAFTGAQTARAGLFEATAGGTVFMDEIGEMPPATQVKLLRVLEEKAVRRVGASKSIPIDVRFIAATHRDLETEVAHGRFRQDLYYRLSGIVLKIPPLRERTLEIEPLARHFLTQFCLQNRLPLPMLTPAALEALRAYHWPGNVRELRNAMERAPFLCAGGELTPEHLPRTARLAAPGRETPPEEHSRSFTTLPVEEATDEAQDEVTDVRPAPPELLGLPPRPRTDLPRLAAPVGVRISRPTPVDERARILEALSAADGNQSRAAELLGVSRRTLINRLDALQLPRPRKRLAD